MILAKKPGTIVRINNGNSIFNGKRAIIISPNDNTAEVIIMSRGNGQKCEKDIKAIISYNLMEEI